MTSTPTIGVRLRDWRLRRRLTQLDLALSAEISARHLSFLETGRAMPSRAMVLRLAEQLQIPLRDRNGLLFAAGYAPAFVERRLDDPVLRPVLDGVRALLKAHEPFPALAVDRRWTLVAGNAPINGLLADAAEWLREPPVNVLRVSLHPDGIARHIRNYEEWRGHLLHRLRRQFADTADAEVGALIDELASYPSPRGPRSVSRPLGDAIAVPLELDSPRGPMRFVSTTMVFGAPNDPLLAELAIETFLPADDATMAAIRGA